MSEFPVATAFKCVESSFKHDTHTFREGNTYQLEDYPDINQAELQMFWKAGWVQVEGWPETPERDVNKVVELEPHNSTIGIQSTDVGNQNG